MTESLMIEGIVWQCKCSYSDYMQIVKDLLIFARTRINISTKMMQHDAAVEFGRQTCELTGCGQKPGRDGAELELAVEHARQVFAIEDRDEEDEG